jgi:hypothetical protein
LARFRYRFAAAVPQTRVVAAQGCGHDLVTDLGPMLAPFIANGLRMTR